MPRLFVGAVVVALAVVSAAAAAAQEQAPMAASSTAVRPEVLAKYVGRYRIQPQMHADITLEGGKLYGALSGRPKHELRAETPTRFAAVDAPAEIVFEPGPDGRATGLILTLNGDVAEARRVADDDPDAP